MNWKRELLPRQVDEARVVAGTMLLAGGAANLVIGASIVSGAVSLNGGASTAFTIAATLLIAGVGVLRSGERLRELLGLPLPLVALTASWVLNLLTRDISLGAMFIPFMPVAYAGFQLRPRAAWAVSAFAFIGQAQTLFHLARPQQATLDLAVMLVVEVSTVAMSSWRARPRTGP